MTPIERAMVVVRAPSTNNKPMVRIKNELLVTSGFDVGTSILVSYQRDIITITKLK